MERRDLKKTAAGSTVYCLQKNAITVAIVRHTPTIDLTL